MYLDEFDHMIKDVITQLFFWISVRATLENLEAVA